jgi:beta-N-acetylhexosaminidase
VLDQGFGCKAIGNRAFGEDSQTILRHSSAYMQGMKAVGMATTGKHFPGHGGVVADSHLETPFDQRSDIVEQDMAIFKAQIDAGILDAMMPAHVIYPHYDPQPASGSEYWLKQVLRQQLGFKGLIFSDDLTMEGAAVMGGPADRALQALNAGCDMLLMCNKRDAQVAALDALPIVEVPLALSLLKKRSFSLSELKLAPQWKEARENMLRIVGH